MSFLQKYVFECFTGRGPWSADDEDAFLLPEENKQPTKEEIKQQLSERQQYKSAIELLKQIRSGADHLEQDIEKWEAQCDSLTADATAALQRGRKDKARRLLKQRKRTQTHIRHISDVLEQIVEYEFKMQRVKYFKDVMDLGEKVTHWARTETMGNKLDESKLEDHADEVDQIDAYIEDAYNLLRQIGTTLSSPSDEYEAEDDIEDELKFLEQQIASGHVVDEPKTKLPVQTEEFSVDCPHQLPVVPFGHPPSEGDDDDEPPEAVRVVRQPVYNPNQSSDALYQL